MLALHLDNLLFLLLVGMAGLLRLLASRVGEKKTKSQDSEPAAPRPVVTIERGPADSDADRIRKFLEALGQPATAAPPPPVTPRSASPPPAPQKPVEEGERRKRKPVWGNPLPPLTTVPPPEEPPRRVTYPRPMSTPSPKAQRVPPKLSQPSVFEVRKEMGASEPAVTVTPLEAYAIPTLAVGQSPQGKINLALLLRSPAALQQAVILREILGPPRSLQPLDFVGA
jgi:hypothetical protein